MKQAYNECLQELFCEPNVFPETVTRITDYVAFLESVVEKPAQEKKVAKKTAKKTKK
jgi:hypothetical protein